MIMGAADRVKYIDPFHALRNGGVAFSVEDFQRRMPLPHYGTMKE